MNPVLSLTKLDAQTAYDPVVATAPSSGDPGIHVAELASKQPRWLNPRWLLFAGAVAITVGFFSIFSVHASPPLIKLRENVRWQSTTTLIITAHAFPYPQPVRSGPGPLAFSSLAALYAQLANSQPVLALARRHGPLNGSYHAAAVGSEATATHVPLPALTIEGEARTSSQATKTAQRISLALTTYIRHKQDEAGIPQAQRVMLKTLGLRTTRTADRHLIVPLTILAAVLALLAVAGLSGRAQRR